jgi:hypothetical protein
MLFRGQIATIVLKLYGLATPVEVSYGDFEQIAEPPGFELAKMPCQAQP